MSVWDEFIAAVKTENELLQRLVSLSEEKQEHINDAQEVARIASKEQNILHRLEEVDLERVQLFDVIAPGQRLEGWLTTLSEEQQEEIGPVILELAENLGTLQTLNELNQQLLAQSLGYVQFSLNLLVGDDSSPTYTRPKGNKPGISIFDRKV